MKKTKIVLIVMGLMALFWIDLNGEESFFKSHIGKTIEVEGKALNAKLGALLDTEYGQIWIDSLEAWPEEVENKIVKVSGKVIEKNDLPVFVANDGGPQLSGMPVKEGTDLKKAAERYLLQSAEWIVLQES